MTTFVFVGERRSRRALTSGATWEQGGLCATTLHAALAAVGLDPHAQVSLNLFEELPDGAAPERPLVVAATAVRAIAAHAADGREIVALGARVERALRKEGVPCRRLHHPAARGAIRRTTVYRAHVAAVLTPAVAA